MLGGVKLLVVVALMAACTPTQWARRSVLVAGDAALLCDMSQTLWMSDHGKYDHDLEEMNPILGRRPSDGTIIAANLSVIAVNTALYFILPTKWGLATTGGVALVEGANVITQPSHVDANGNVDVPYAQQHHGFDLQRKL